VIFSAKFFFFTFCLLWLFQWLFVSVMPVEEEDQAEWREKKKKQGWTSRASHAQFLAQFLVRLATKIVAFFIKLADFTLVGPAGPISDMARSLAATSMVWKHCFTPWCESSRILKKEKKTICTRSPITY
jgi:hypothetical protein